MTKLLIAYFATGVVFWICDFLWLGFAAKDFYQAQIGALLRTPPNIPAAIAFYLLYVVGLVIFGTWRGLEADAWGKAALYGALFGFFAYATYDLTNFATLKGWSMSMTLVDIAWGTFVSGVAAALGCVITRAATT